MVTGAVGVIVSDIAVSLVPMAAVLTYQHFSHALVVGVGGIDTMPNLRTVGNLRVGAMAAKLVGLVGPPAVAMFRMEAGIVVRATTYFTNSVWHILQS